MPAVSSAASLAVKEIDSGRRLRRVPASAPLVSCAAAFTFRAPESLFSHDQRKSAKAAQAAPAAMAAEARQEACVL